MRKVTETTFVRVLALVVFALGVIVQGSWAQEPKSSSKAETSEQKSTNGDAALKQQVRDALDRLERLENEVRRLKKKAGVIPEDKKEQRVAAMLENAHLGSLSFGSPSGVRYFASKLILINLTPKEIVVKPADITLNADGKQFELKSVPAQLQNYSFNVGGQSVSLRNMNPVAQIKVAPGRTGVTPMVFSGLAQNTDVPRMVLKIKIGDKTNDLDVNEFSLGQLELDSRRIGPRNSLGLLTIGGRLNSINVRDLADEFDQFAAKKVARVVLRWREGAAPVDSQLLGWLTLAANQAGREGVTTQNQLFPQIPVTIAEFHLAEIPKRSSSSYRTSSNIAPTVHKKTADAVSAALKTAFEAIPRDELLDEIENGNPLTQAAALENGGGRLLSEQLPVILKHADSNNPAMQKAAVVALRHFGEPQAIGKLVESVKKNAKPLSDIAIESLASSRFSAAHDALLKILENEDTESRKRIVKVLANYPRPIWSDTIYEFAKDRESGIGVDAVRALVQIGHPKLFEVLRDSLKSTDKTYQDLAYQELTKRSDPESEAIAIDYTLKYIEKKTPTTTMLSYLGRVKDRRAKPLLLKYLNESNTNRSTLISTLAQLGDQDVAAEFVKLYPKLRNYEQTAVLNALGQMQSPEFLRLCKTALSSTDSSLINAACQGLQNEASKEAVDLLVQTFDKSTHPTQLMYAANALGTLGTAKAKTLLREARLSKNNTKRQYAQQALRTMLTRSPAYQYIAQAQQSSRTEKWDAAVQQYSLAVQIDPDLPDAFAGRGNAHLNLKKRKEARQDFETAAKLDPTNSQALTGVSIITVLEGKPEEGIKLIESNREKFANDSLFAYNAACVYGRAIEYLNEHKEVKDREKKQELYKQKAIGDLKSSVKRGFRDLNWMKKDPDLKSLHGIPEFEEIHSPSATAGSTEAKKEG